MRVAAIAIAVLAIAAAPARAADPVLVAAGDIACNPDSSSYFAGEGTATQCRQKHTSDLVAPIDPLHVLALGDLQYEDGKLERFQVSYDASWGRSAIKAKTKPVPGNHEYGAGHAASNPPDWIDADANATGYFTYFADQLQGLGADADDPARGWYSFDIPVGGSSWHVVALNSECAAGLRVEVGWEGGCAAGSEQEQWLRADLAANRSDCTLAYWHHPRFSSGANGDTPIMEPIWAALYEDYADVVLTGHDHHYERFAQTGAGGGLEPGRGIRSWMVGTGGKNMGVLDPAPRAQTEIRDNQTFGVLKLTLHGPAAGHPRGWYQWEFVDDGQPANTFSDSGSGDCVGPPRPAVRSATTVKARDTLAPLVSRARLSRRRFRLGSRTMIGFTLSEASTTSLRFDRRRKIRGRIRHRKVATLKRKFTKGRTRLKFTGRVGRRKLSPGLYRLTITVKDSAGNPGKPRRLFFRLLP